MTFTAAFGERHVDNQSYIVCSVQISVRQRACMIPHLSGEGCQILCQLPRCSPLLCPPSSSSTANVRWQRSLLDLNRKCIGRQCSPPDLNSQLWTAVFPAGLQPRVRRYARMSEHMKKICQKNVRRDARNHIRNNGKRYARKNVREDMPQIMSEDLPEIMSEDM